MGAALQTGTASSPSTPKVRRGWRIGGRWSAVFLFFSNRLGCLGSLLVSLVLTALLVLLLRR
jgi:hypothetical protein